MEKEYSGIQQPVSATVIHLEDVYKKTQLVGKFFNAVVIVSFIMSFYFHQYLSCCFLMGSLFSSILLTNAVVTRKKKIAITLGILGHNVFLVLISFAVGKDFGVYFYFFPLFAGIPMLIENNKSHNKKIFFYESITSLSVVFVMIFCPFKSNWQNISQASVDFFYLFNCSCCFIATAAITFIVIFLERNYIAGIILEKQKAEDAAQARTHFLSKMSHELRTPLNGILGAKNILDQHPYKDQTEYFNIIQSCSSRMLDLVNDVLDFNKLQANELKLHFTNVNMLCLLQKTLFPFQRIAKQKKIKLHSQIDERLNMFVLVDDIRLLRVINNLLSNAIKFTTHGSITLKVLVMQEKENSIEIYIAIEDTGIGIEDEHLKNIFKSFWQVYEDSMRQYEGTGLGLSISQELLLLMRSKLEVMSVWGKGSNFFFKIIVEKSFTAKSNAGQQDCIAQAYNSLMGKRILIAEDNEINLIVISKVLQMKNVKLFTAVNGQEALECMEKNEIDLVLLDLEMPVMDGYTAILYMKKLYPYIPVIAFTASLVDTKKHNELLQMGFDDCITKPFKPAQVFEKIETFLIDKKYAL